MNKKQTKKDRGFTLIELLVVIAIIGLLSSMSVYAINVARMKARDARRASDMKQIMTAIEMYADDHGGEYFSTGGVSACLGLPSTEQCWNGPYGNDALNLALKPYLPNIPKDPLYGKRSYNAYIYNSPGRNWLPSPINTRTGTYSIAFETEEYPSKEACMGWEWASWDNYPGPHCSPWCRHCGYLGQ